MSQALPCSAEYDGGDAMSKFAVGSVPFVNARPLVAWFESLGSNSPVNVVYDVPSNLPLLLDSGDVQAVLVSSYDALSTPNRTIAEDRKSTRLNSSHIQKSRMPSSA